jgi:hypothetical protein
MFSSIVYHHTSNDFIKIIKVKLNNNNIIKTIKSEDSFVFGPFRF